MRSTFITGFVLAGGKSSRLGQDKVLLPWGRGTLLSHAIRRLEQVCGTVSICSDRADLTERATRLATKGTPHPLVRDAARDAGPLAGMVAALENTRTAWNFFLAVDLPLVPVPFLRDIASRIPDVHAPNLRAPGMQATPDSDSAGPLLGLLPRVNGRPQPLCGIYHRSLAPGLRRALEEGKYRLMLALAEAAVAVGDSFASAATEVERPRLPMTPPFGLRFVEIEDRPEDRAVSGDRTTTARRRLSPTDWFFNINTSEDFDQVRDLAVNG